MKNTKFLLRATALAVALTAASPVMVNAEDIDLFISATASSGNNNPNILIVIDNTANWSRNDQHWSDPNGLIAPFKQGQSELRAIRRVVEESNDKVNIGLMMFHDGDPKGAYIRYAVRPMTDANKAVLSALIGPDSGCVDGIVPPPLGNGTPRCIFKNFDSSEKVPASFSDYSGAMFEAFKYLGGCTSPDDAQSGVCKTNTGRTLFGTERYSNALPLANTRYDVAAYTDASLRAYNPPITTANSCGKNYVIFIGNGFPASSADGGGDPAGLLRAVEGNAAKLAMPTFTTTSNTVQAIIGAACSVVGGNTNTQRGSCSNNIPSSLTNQFPADSYACVGNPISDPTNLCGGRSRFDVQSNKTVIAVTATGQSAVPPDNIERKTDEWARYLFNTDVNGAPGIQNGVTYTIDVFKDAQDKDQTALLFSMAKYGGGRYFQASSEQAILKALQDIMIEIQSVNSVFASASLPINATNRSQNENQVFIGMFRPYKGPRWYGNLKRYQIAQFGQDFKLADASSPPQEAVSGATGFINPCAVSFWTTDTTSFDPSDSSLDTSYWAFSDPAGSHAGTCTTSSFSLYSDYPDGPQVEKGATAQVVRLGNLESTTPDYTEHRNVYTCANDGSNIKCDTSMFTLDTTNVTAGATFAVDADHHDRIISFARGLDIDDANSRLDNKDVRPTVHGDVAHSRPLPVNYGSITGTAKLGCDSTKESCVVLFYGANDGAFRAVAGNTGAELWSFIAPEHHWKLSRLADDKPLISFPPTPAPDSLPKDYYFDGSAGLFQTINNDKVWVFPAMRRGGRMIYAFNVTDPEKPEFKWRVGCVNEDLADTASCIDATGTASKEFEQMGQTWSTPSVARAKGYGFPDDTAPIVIVGAGYDTCDDQNVIPNTSCDESTRRGNRVYIIDGDTGRLVKEFATHGSVAGDLTLVDRNFDAFVDHAYLATTTGRIYRVDFVDPSDPNTALTCDSTACNWTMTLVAFSDGDNRKFLFPPAALPSSRKVYLSGATGDRERPLENDYPFPVSTTLPGVLNRAYMVIDEFSGTPVDLDDASVMADLTTGASCTTPPVELMTPPKQGWFINLNAANTTSDPDTNVGEQGVTSTTIFGGLVFFSTNRPIPAAAGSCTNNLGEARGYALNLLNASGAADTLGICGGARSGVFVGGGLPPSPVTGVVPVGGRLVTVMIGGVQRGGGVSAPIGAQRVTPTITQRRSRIYWYNDGDK
jgi:type IV pilus assembly protein PilY1